MDDKTLNLWRQIEGARRAGRRHVSDDGKSGGQLSRPAVSS
jgi:hypothetical protein